MEDAAVVVKKSISKLIKENRENAELNKDSVHLKSIREIVKNKTDSVPVVVFQFLLELRKCDSDERKVLLLAIHYFFTRSSFFRQLVVDNVQDILRYVCEIDPQHYPLPGPTAHAKSLKILGIKIIKEWHQKFACAYVKLQSVVDFLKQSKALGFEDNSAEMRAERIRREEEDKRKELHAQKVMESIQVKWTRVKNDVDRTITEIEAALRILIPLMGDDVAPGRSDPSDFAVSQQLHALRSETISLTIEHVQPTVEVTEDNDTLVENVLDGKAIGNALKKTMEKYLSKLAGLGPSTERMVKEIIDAKIKLDKVLLKIDDVKFEGKVRRKKQKNDDEDSDDEWDEVPEKQVEDFVNPVDDRLPQYVIDLYSGRTDKKTEDEPCCSKSIQQEQPEKPSIPQIPYGLDLKYWGVDRKDVEVPKNNADCHRFWRPPDEDTIVAKEQDCVFSTRVFTFVGEPKNKSDRQCRVRLANDQLCPRRDFVRCPLHGPIIDRDEEGFPLNPMEEETAEKEESRFKKSLEKEEEEYKRDLEKQVGVSLGEDRSRRKRKKNELSEGAERRKRLEKKLLDPRAIKRISQVMDEARKKKLAKTFGQQFSHL